MDETELQATLAHTPTPAAAAPARVPPPSAGLLIGDYQLIRCIGEGGMGVVWEAEQADTGRRVALKLLSPRLRHSAETVDRFIREGRMAAAVSHPRSTFVFGAGDFQGQPYIAMELMPGRNLADVVGEQGPLPISHAVDAILDVIEGLEAAHALNVIHRDVKPSNCFLDSDGRVKVGDFGLSKSLVSDAALTRTGAFLGTPQFAAPEQARGGEIDRRTDIYSVGATLFFLLTGRAPFEGDAAAVISQIASEPAPRITTLRNDVPRALARVVARTLEKDPSRRYAVLADLRAALLPFASSSASIADVGRRAAAFMVDLIVAASCAWIAYLLTVDLNYVVAYFNSSRLPLFDPPEAPWLATLQLWSDHVAFIGYFALCEACWGCGAGKLLMGLRVVDMRGQTPRIWRTIGRALLVPGLMRFAALLNFHVLPEQLLGDSASIAAANALLEEWAPVLPGYALVALCWVSMRSRNGYRGLHEFATGTRVVRPRPASEAAEQVEIALLVPVVAGESARRFGPYAETGLLGICDRHLVLAARDEKLQRPVWIRVRDGDSVRTPDVRWAISRIARPRWLQGGVSENLSWDAYEAVQGSPLKIAVEGSSMDWACSRKLLLDLAEELAASVDDGSLPAQLSIDQVWVDRSGHARLLDAALLPPNGAAVKPDAENTTSNHDVVAELGDPPSNPLQGLAELSPAERAVSLLRDVQRLCARGQHLPGHALRFSQELGERPGDRSTLTWAVEQLRGMADMPTTLHWDDRLGIMCVSMGVESSLYSIGVVVLGAIIVSIPWFSRAVSFAIYIPLLLALPLLVGYWFYGGPVFRFLGVEIRRGDGQLASRWRCAWRNFLAWSAVLCWQAMGTWQVLDTTLIEQLDQLDQVLPETLFSEETLPMLMYSLFACGTLLCTFPYFFGVVFAILRPQRGLQDLFSGTHLVPK